MADETNPEIPAAPKKPAARKPTTSGPGAAPRKPAAAKAPAAPKNPDAVAATPSVPEPVAPAVPVVPEAVAAPAIPVPPIVAEPAAATVADPAAAPYAAPLTAPAKRKIWPFVLGGGILLFILIVVGLIIAVVSIFGALGGDPKKAVTDYDTSFATADCDLFLSTTTTAFQDNFFGEAFDCGAWEDNAKALTVDGVYQYEVKIVISKEDGDTAEVVTNETDSSSGDPVDYTLRYYLTKVDGHWLIDGIDNES